LFGFSTLIMTTDSDLFRLLKRVDGRSPSQPNAAPVPAP